MGSHRNFKRVTIILCITAVLGVAVFLITKKAPSENKDILSKENVEGDTFPRVIAPTIAAVAPPAELGLSSAVKRQAIRSVGETNPSWQYKYGYRVPERYERKSETELAALARQGDSFASQMLAEITWSRTGSREDAAKYYQDAIERGSVGAIGELFVMYAPDMTPGLAQNYQDKFGKSLEPNLNEAYIWARTAMFRGDLNGTFAIERLKDSLTPRQIANLELAALENFLAVKAQYKINTGKELLPMDSDAQRSMFSRAAGAGG